MTSVLQNPASGVFLVIPSDSADLAIMTRYIRATTAGNIRITGADGVDVVCAFAAGETRAIRAKKIWATNTSSTGIEGMH